LGAAIEGFGGGDATNLSYRSIEPHQVAWLVTPGITGRLKRRRLSRTAKRRHSSERPVPRGGRPTRANAGSDPRCLARAQGGGTHLGFRANAPPSRGVRDRRPQRRVVALTRSGSPGASTRCERGSAPPRECTHDREVCGPVRGGVSPAERRREPSLEAVRSARASFFGSTPSRGSSARVIPERGRTKAKAG